MKLYSIGQVSTILGMSIKTIRYYDEIGLCSPSSTDKVSGYRHYSIDDIMRLDAIRCLGRELGMPLRSIREYMESGADPKLLMDYLRQQEREIDSEIETLLDRRSLLNEKLDAIIRMELTSLQIPSITTLPERTIYASEQSSGSFDEGMFAVRRMAASSKAFDKQKLYLLKRDLNQGGAYFTWDDFFAGTDIPSAVPGTFALTLKAGRYVVINYQNELENRRQAFQIFRDYISENALHAVGPLIFEYAILEAASIKIQDMIVQMQILLEDT